MTTYIATITFRDALPDDFDKLNRKMAKARFFPARNISADQPGACATYSFRTDLSLPMVINAAYRIARSINRNYSLTVTKKLQELIAA